MRPRLVELAEPVVERCGAELIAVELTNEHGEDVLRLFIDRPGGVSVADCTRVSHAMSPVLDVHDPFPGRFRLEVSSPGMDRPVQRREDFLRFSGFRARLRLTPRSGRRRFTGVLAGLDGDDLLFRVNDELRRYPLTDVDRVRLILDPDEYARLGREGLPPVPSDAGVAPAPSQPDGTQP
ncbi:MAG: ribosome maturation factor RimP [Deltaproteobacteria bacterium]|nr:MAG: ribosome maturation factor RimP [Deltaproteobacteria bacterium]